MAQVKILDDQNKLTQKLNKYLLPFIHLAFKNIVEEMSPQIKTLVIEQLLNSSHFNALLTEQEALYGAFGTIHLKEVMSEIPKLLESDIKLTTQVVNTNSVLGNIRVKILDKSYKRYLDIPEASYVSYNKRRKTAHLIEWLKWLLIEGDLRIDEWHIIFGNDLKGSRTGIALMKKGGHWILPEPFVGDNINDNFLSRAVLSIDPEQLFKDMSNKFYRELQNAIN